MTKTQTQKALSMYMNQYSFDLISYLTGENEKEIEDEVFNHLLPVVNILYTKKWFLELKRECGM